MTWRQIPGWAAFAHDVYDDYIDNFAKDGDVVVEVGVLFGKSLAYLARRAMDKGLKIEIHAVDPWDGEHWLPVGHPYRDIANDLGGPYEGFLKIMRKYAPEEFAYITEERIHRMKSVEGRKLFEDHSCALVLLDDDHSLEGCSASIAAWRSAVAEGGMLAGDDYDPVAFPAVVRAVKDAFGEGNYTVRGTSWLEGKRGKRPIDLASSASAEAIDLPVATTEWVEAETIGGSWRVGRLVQKDATAGLIVLSPCYHTIPMRVVVPVPIPMHGINLCPIDVADPPVWGDGSEQTIHFASFAYISQERLDRVLRAQNRSL